MKGLTTLPRVKDKDGAARNWTDVAGEESGARPPVVCVCQSGTLAQSANRNTGEMQLADISKHM